MSTPSAKTLARKAARIEVALLRSPLLLADRAAARVGAGAVRSTVQQGLAVLDAVADRLADASDVPRATATTPARPANPSPRPAVAAEEPTELQEPDEGELVEQVAEELLEEQELAPLAGELAEDEKLRRVQAELNAKRLVEEQQPPQQE